MKYNRINISLSIVLFLSILLYQNCAAQTLIEKPVDTYTLIDSLESIKIPMNYGKFTFEKFPIEDSIQKKIIRMDVVYTKHPENYTFTRLNKNRINTVRSNYPKISSSTPHYSFGQSKAKVKEEAEALFHGVVLYYPKAKEVIIQNKDIDPELITEFKIKDDTLTANGLRVYKNLIYVRNLIFGSQTITDTIVTSVMNKHPEWHDLLVIDDWTGSMYAYGSQIIKWHLQNLQTTDSISYVFFNDGDDLADHKKKIGSIGGIYTCKTNNPVEAFNSMGDCLRGGHGGDGPENNIEATLFGIEKYPNTHDIIFIADARAPIKDIKLYRSIGKKMHIILCGANKGVIHPDYFFLAGMTNSDIFTLEEELSFTDQKCSKQSLDMPGILKVEFSETGFTYFTPDGKTYKFDYESYIKNRAAMLNVK